MPYVKKRGNKYHFQKRVPKRLENAFSKKFIQVSLDTDSKLVAQQRAHSLMRMLDELWSELNPNKSKDFEELYKNAIQAAKLNGFQYKSAHDIARQSSLGEIINRVNTATQSTYDTQKALLGLVHKPEVTISKARDVFFKHEMVNLKSKSESQLRKWKNPRSKAIKNFISVVGDKPVAEISRTDILNFRDWWLSKIDTKTLSHDSANKEFSTIKKVIEIAVDNYDLPLSPDSLFKKIRLKKIEKNQRIPFETGFIKDTLFNKEKLNMNFEARMLIHVMADTGARISELVGLENSDIILLHVIPHIKIRPNSTRQLKTKQSERDIPLVGSALYAFQQLTGPFKKYFNKADTVSSSINKYCRENDIFPSSNHSLYSLRHSFEDRLTSVEPPDKLQAALMGHTYHRPRYGLGPSLEQKKNWLDKIAFRGFQ